jgi:hypothetical protein
MVYPLNCKHVMAYVYMTRKNLHYSQESLYICILSSPSAYSFAPVDNAKATAEAALSITFNFFFFCHNDQIPISLLL